jgi:hypothetical protein
VSLLGVGPGFLARPRNTVVFRLRSFIHERRGRGILRSSNARFCIDSPLRAARMASEATHAAW